jgi:hypothetical protein
MTRKAHQVDRDATATSRFQDKRSYVRTDGHEFLFGEDVRNRRQEIYDRDLGICQGCGLRVSYTEFHMHHKQGGLVGRCTCMHNLETLCAKCHWNEHPQVMSGKIGE